MLLFLQVVGRTPYGADWYVLGNSPTIYADGNSSNNVDGLFTANRNGNYLPRLLDYGSSRLCPYQLTMHCLLIVCVSYETQNG